MYRLRLRFLNNLRKQIQSTLRSWRWYLVVLLLLYLFIIDPIRRGLGPADLMADWTLASIPMWNWIELLLIPVVLVSGFYWMNNRQLEQDKAARTSREEERALETYLSRMSLLIEKGLRKANADDPIVDLAYAYTRRILRITNGKWKEEAVRFLGEAELISLVRLHEVELKDLNLQWAKLNRADLHGIQFSGTDLSWAEIKEADLRNSDLRWIKLREAELQGTDLSESRMLGADLRGVNLEKANLSGADLEAVDLRSVSLEDGQNPRSTNLREVNLKGANLKGAWLVNADLTGANLEGANLQGTDFWGATLPNGAHWTAETNLSKFTHPPEEEIE